MPMVLSHQLVSSFLGASELTAVDSCFVLQLKRIIVRGAHVLDFGLSFHAYNLEVFYPTMLTEPGTMTKLV